MTMLLSVLRAAAHSVEHRAVRIRILEAELHGPVVAVESPPPGAQRPLHQARRVRRARRRAQLDVTSGVRVERAAVAKTPAAGGEAFPADLLGAHVRIGIDARNGMADQSDQRLDFRQRLRRAALRQGRIRQLTRAVAADAGTGEKTRLKIEVFRHDGHDRPGTAATGEHGVVAAPAEIGDARTEEAGETIGLEVAEARIVRGLDDHVRPGVETVVDCRREAAAARVGGAGRAHDRAGAVRADIEVRLRIFDRRGQPELVIGEVGGNPELRFPRPGEARHILCVDGERHILRSRHDAGLVERQQAPGLSGEDVQVPVGVVVLAVRLAQAGIVAVALVGIGGRRCALEIRFAVSGERLGGRRFTFDQQGEAALPRGEARLVLMILRAVRERDAVPVGRNIRNLVAAAEDAGAFDKPAELDRDATHPELPLLASVGHRLLAAGDRGGGHRRAGRRRCRVAELRRRLRVGRRRWCVACFLPRACGVLLRGPHLCVALREVALDVSQFVLQRLDLRLDGADPLIGVLRPRPRRQAFHSRQGRGDEQHRPYHPYRSHPESSALAPTCGGRPAADT